MSLCVNLIAVRNVILYLSPIAPFYHSRACTIASYYIIALWRMRRRGTDKRNDNTMCDRLGTTLFQKSSCNLEFVYFVSVTKATVAIMGGALVHSVKLKIIRCSGNSKLQEIIMLELGEWEYSYSNPSIDLLRLEMPAFHTPKTERTLPVQTPLLANKVQASMLQTRYVLPPLDRIATDKSLGKGLQSYLYLSTSTRETNLEKTKSPPLMMYAAWYSKLQRQGHSM